MARQVLDNGETYLSHRTKLNEMMTEVYHPHSAGAVVYVDVNYNPPAGTVADGSFNSPFNDLSDAFNAVNPGANGGAVELSIGTYIDFLLPPIPSGVSLINPYGRGQVVIQSNINAANTSTQFEKLTVTGSVNLGSDDADVESIVIIQCNLNASVTTVGGTTGTDSFVFIDCIFGAIPGSNTCSFRGAFTVLESPFFGDGADISIGRTTPSGAPLHAVKITNGLIQADSFFIFAEPGKETNVTIFNTEFDVPIGFDTTTGTINLELDQLTFDELLKAGTNFQVAGLNTFVTGVGRYISNNEIINSEITDDPFQDVITLATGGLPNGLYEFKASFVWEVTGSNRALRWQFTGSLPSPVFQQEAADNDDVQTWTYIFPFEVTEPFFTITLEAQMESGAVAATITAANLMMERKL